MNDRLRRRVPLSSKKAQRETMSQYATQEEVPLALLLVPLTGFRSWSDPLLNQKHGQAIPEGH